jgi:hypothetical protein
MITTRSYDFTDLVVNSQKAEQGYAPTSGPHNLGLSIGETDIFDSGAAVLTNVKANPRTIYITHIAIGTDATPIDKATQTGLIAEHSRWLIDVFQPLVPSGTGALCTHVYQALFPQNVPLLLTPAKDNWVYIREIGLFSGTTLVSRQLLAFDNRPIAGGGSHAPLDLLVSWVFSFVKS